MSENRDEAQSEETLTTFGQAWQQVADSIVQLGQALQTCFLEVAEQVIPIAKTIYETMYEAYREAGMPYGDSHEGFMHWMEDIGKIKHLEGEIERIRMHHSMQVSVRKLGEKIRAEAQEETGAQ